jgi:WD40 repeat protein
MGVPTSMTFSPSGWELLTSGRDRVLHVWDLRRNNLKKTIPVFELVEGISIYHENETQEKGGKKNKEKVTSSPSPPLLLLFSFLLFSPLLTLLYLLF